MITLELSVVAVTEAALPFESINMKANVTVEPSAMVFFASIVANGLVLSKLCAEILEFPRKLPVRVLMASLDVKTIFIWSSSFA